MSANSASSSNTKAFQEKGVQTVIKVYPFVLLPSTSRASVTSDKKFCTVLSLEASQQSSKFYSLLQYCPYYEIEENSIRVINLPRKTKLQWVTQNHFSEEVLQNLTLVDDDGVADICNDLLLRMRSGKKSTFIDADTQTYLTVRPFLVEDPNIAIVYRTIGTQVILVTCSSSKSSEAGSFLSLKTCI